MKKSFSIWVLRLVYIQNRMKVLNNSKKQSSRQPIKEINLKTTSIQELYNMAEQYYYKLSQAQQNKWHAIISRGGTRKDKISLMATQIIKNPHTSLQQFEQLVKWCFDQNHHFALDSCQTLVNIYHEYVFADKSSLKIFLDSVQAQIREQKEKSRSFVRFGWILLRTSNQTFLQLIDSKLIASVGINYILCQKIAIHLLC